MQTTITRVDRTHATGDVLGLACGHTYRYRGCGEHGAGYFVQAGHPFRCTHQDHQTEAIGRAAIDSILTGQPQHFVIDPAPHDHATRDAAQRADEAELLTYDSPPQIPTYSDHPNGIIGAIVEYLDPPLYAEKFPHDDEAHAYAGWAAQDDGRIVYPVPVGQCRHPSAVREGPRLRCPDCGAWLLGPMGSAVPVMAGGSEDLDTHAVRELDLYAENTSELYPQFQAIIANLQRKIAKGTYDAARAPKLWRYWYDAAAKRYQTDVCPMRFPPAVRQAAAEQRASDEYQKITAGEYDPAPERILAP